ncbi:MAG TPA: ParB/RepB/Spo0J family partition protein [Arcobacter sp.]|nr:ParB/RepB/Spo0J family partition protein [Arcobacter sp.]
MALGRGLSELLAEVETAYENNTQDNTLVQEIDLALIKVNPYQPRKIFDEDKIQELSESIESHGLLQPIVLTKDGNSYTLVAGERRFRATKLLNKSSINAIILDIEDKQLREYALIENIQRSDLNILEVAYSYESLINEHNITHEELSNMVYKSRSSITNILRLLTLSAYTQQMISSDKISLGHAKLIIGLSEDTQKMIVDSVIGQRLSVRETEKLVKELKNDKDSINKTNKAKKVNYDLTSLSSIVDKFNDEELRIKITNNSFNIAINSQEDIEKILKFFNNNNPL